LDFLLTCDEATSFQLGAGQQQQAVRARVVGARLPALDRVRVHAQPRAQLTLGQTRPPAEPQRQALETLARKVVCPVAGGSVLPASVPAAGPLTLAHWAPQLNLPAAAVWPAPTF